MNSRNAGGANSSATTPRPTARDLLLGRRYGVHRLIVFCLVVVLVVVIVYAVIAGRTATLEGLPGVARIDGVKHEVELAARVTPAEARVIFDRAQQLEDSWTLRLGSVSLATPQEPEVIDQPRSVDLLQRLGTARLAEPGVIIVDPYSPVIDAEPATPDRAIPLARALVAALAAGEPVPADRLAVRDSPTAGAKVTVAEAALHRPAEVDEVLALLQRVPKLHQAVLGERLKVRVQAKVEAGAESACRDARQVLGQRADLDLSVQFGHQPEPGDDAESKSRPC
ncbi:hypothetical protein [Microlunatus speluncae]|uniref:hypothetical protein n=1 Tax=Microlunatus speluncae TaxID=2594267 RepID=UPI0012661835|nr:hypothetical protein [Microlunatus speluncae]